MSRRLMSIKGVANGGFLLVELVGGIALLGLCGLIFAMMQGRLAQNGQQTEFGDVKQLLKLDMAIRKIQAGHSLPGENGPFKVRHKELVSAFASKGYWVTRWPHAISLDRGYYFLAKFSGQ